MQDNLQPQHLAFRAHHRQVITRLLFDNERIITGSDDTEIHVHDIETGFFRKRLEGHTGAVWALQYDGDTLVSGSTDCSVRVWDLKTGRCLHVFQGHTSTVRCLVILRPVEVGKKPDGAPIVMPKEPSIVTGSRDSTLRVWKLPRPGATMFFFRSVLRPTAIIRTFSAPCLATITRCVKLVREEIRSSQAHTTVLFAFGRSRQVTLFIVYKVTRRRCNP